MLVTARRSLRCQIWLIFRLIYAGSTLLCVLSMKSLGLDWFSLCVRAFCASTGGYGLYNEGVAHYQSQGVKVLMMLFMLFSSVNFLLHYQFFILRGWLFT